jgi:hypothetical protein
MLFYKICLITHHIYTYIYLNVTILPVIEIQNMNISLDGFSFPKWLSELSSVLNW